MKRSTFMIASRLFMLVLVYLTRVRPWQLRWGATHDEIEFCIDGGLILGWHYPRL